MHRQTDQMFPPSQSIKRRKRKPFTMEHVKFINDFLKAVEHPLATTLNAATSIGYFFGWLGGEYTCSKASLRLGVCMMKVRGFCPVFDGDETAHAQIRNTTSTPTSTASTPFDT
eukprot:130717_1